MIRYLLSIAVMSLSSFACHADYYLKFTASGATLSGPLSASSDAWLKVSIVDSHPSDGPIHFKGSQLGSDLFYKRYTATKSEGVDNLHFYVADVPRSITIRETGSGARSTLTHGDPEITLASGSSVLLPNRMLVAPGVSKDLVSSPNVLKIYVSAAMPVSGVAVSHFQSVAAFPYTSNVLASGVCQDGWQKSNLDGEAVMTWAAAARSNGSCETHPVFVGYLTHLFEFR